MQSFASDFAFIGTRDYVHGPTFFEVFRDRVMEAAGAPATAGFSFRFLRVNKIALANGTIVVASEAEPRPDSGRPTAEMSCKIGDHDWYAAFYDHDSRPIVRRVEPREKDYVSDIELSAPFSGTAKLSGMRNNADLFQAVVEANKQVHLKTLTGDPLSTAIRFRYVYCLDYRCAPTIGDGTGRVNVHNDGLRAAGEYEFSLTRLYLQLGGFNASFKLCFASKDMKGRAQMAQS